MFESGECVIWAKRNVLSMVVTPWNSEHLAIACVTRMILHQKIHLVRQLTKLVQLRILLQFLGLLLREPARPQRHVQRLLDALKKNVGPTRT